MQLSKKMEEALNEQINKEIYSEYIYLAMSAYSTSINLDGFANWFKIQAEEEHEHAMKIYHFINEKRGRVKLKSINEPPFEYESIEKAIEKTLEHEEFVTKSIHELVDLAIKENDHSSVNFLQWFVAEQVEEEANADAIFQKLKMIKGNINGILSIDAKLGKRKGD